LFKYFWFQATEPDFDYLNQKENHICHNIRGQFYEIREEVAIQEQKEMEAESSSTSTEGRCLTTSVTVT
jgi:hypothetical protein